MISLGATFAFCCHRGICSIPAFCFLSLFSFLLFEGRRSGLKCFPSCRDSAGLHFTEIYRLISLSYLLRLFTLVEDLWVLGLEGSWRTTWIQISLRTHLWFWNLGGWWSCSTSVYVENGAIIYIIFNVVTFTLSMFNWPILFYKRLFTHNSTFIEWRNSFHPSPSLQWKNHHNKKIINFVWLSTNNLASSFKFCRHKPETHKWNSAGIKLNIF